jgi:plasmid stabilization system protein ParE
MKFTVEWLPAAEQDLAAIWVNASDQAEVTAAANAIDQALMRNPHTLGEGRLGVSRILVVAPLAVEYDVIVDDGKVVVWHVWRWGLPPP